MTSGIHKPLAILQVTQQALSYTLGHTECSFRSAGSICLHTNCAPLTVSLAAHRNYWASTVSLAAHRNYWASTVTLAAHRNYWASTVTLAAHFDSGCPQELLGVPRESSITTEAWRSMQSITLLFGECSNTLGEPVFDHLGRTIGRCIQVSLDTSDVSLQWLVLSLHCYAASWSARLFEICRSKVNLFCYGISAGAFNRSQLPLAPFQVLECLPMYTTRTSKSCLLLAECRLVCLLTVDLPCYVCVLLHICLKIYLATYLSIYLVSCLSVSLSVYLSFFGS